MEIRGNIWCTYICTISRNNQEQDSPMAKILHLLQEEWLQKHSLLAQVHPQTDFKLYIYICMLYLQTIHAYMSCIFWPSCILRVRQIKRGFVITVIFNFIPTSCKDSKFINASICLLTCHVQSPAWKTHASNFIDQLHSFITGEMSFPQNNRSKRLSGKDYQFCFASKALGNPGESKYKLHHCFCMVLHTKTWTSWTCLFGCACMNFAIIQLEKWQFSLQPCHHTIHTSEEGKDEKSYQQLVTSPPKKVVAQYAW